MRKGADSAMIIANTAPDEAVWTKPETAEFLKIKVRTLDDWIRKKRIPFAKLPSGSRPIPEVATSGLRRQV